DLGTVEDAAEQVPSGGRLHTQQVFGAHTAPGVGAEVGVVRVHVGDAADRVDEVLVELCGGVAEPLDQERCEDRCEDEQYHDHAGDHRHLVATQAPPGDLSQGSVLGPASPGEGRGTGVGVGTGFHVDHLCWLGGLRGSAHRATTLHSYTLVE